MYYIVMDDRSAFNELVRLVKENPTVIGKGVSLAVVGYMYYPYIWTLIKLLPMIKMGYDAYQYIPPGMSFVMLGVYYKLIGR
jgi:hypothetical protein